MLGVSMEGKPRPNVELTCRCDVSYLLGWEGQREAKKRAKGAKRLSKSDV
jgi:hypothetical protein